MSSGQPTFPASLTLTTFGELFAGIAGYVEKRGIPGTPFGAIGTAFAAFGALSETLKTDGSARDLFRTGTSFLLVEASHLGLGYAIGAMVAGGPITAGTIASIAIAAALTWSAQQILEAFGEAIGGLLFDIGSFVIGGLQAGWETLNAAIQGLLEWQIDGGVIYNHASLGDIVDLFQKLDPLILDLDGDGIETIALDGSNVHFDYDGDGFAERTGWAAADDGMLAFDANGNGIVDGMHELFGSPTQDGFEVLETLDSNNDGVIDSGDARFTDLRVWRDLDQDGVSDAGELMTLAEAGVASISLTRTDVAGTTNGHDIGFGGTFTRADGSTGTAQTIYFATDRQDTIEISGHPTLGSNA